MRTQDVDLMSLLAGVLFTGLGLWFTVATLGLGRLDLGLVWPILFVVAGVAVLLAAKSRLFHQRGGGVSQSTPSSRERSLS